MITLIFVYNADSDIFSSVTDAMHKIVSPDTYKCNLCKLTYGNVAIREEWRNFLATLTAHKEFLHKDEFVASYPNLASVELPAILLKTRDGIEPFISAKDINAQTTLDDLIALVSRKVTELRS